MTGLETKAVLAIVLAAFGIYAPVSEFAAAMILGLAGCYAGMLYTPTKERLTVWATLFCGLVICLLVVIGHPHLPFGASGLPLQLVVPLAGFGSRWIGGSVVELGKGVQERSRKLPGEFKLPGGDA